MAALLTEDVKTHSGSATRGRRGAAPNIEANETLVELGIWLSGLESFLSAGHQVVGDDQKGKDAAKEFRIVHSTLQRCAMLNALVLGMSHDETTPIAGQITFVDLRALSSVLRDACLVSEGMVNSDSLGTSEWRAWGNMLQHRFAALPAYQRLIRHAEAEGERYLPENLLRLAQSKESVSPEQAELALILPRFARVLKWLSVIGKMLAADQPLKPALLIFSRIHEQIHEMTSYINNRLERFPDSEAEMFASLDAASYTAAIELKKVYSQELAGLARLRQSPSVFARTETAHSLLSDGFQQILAGFSRLVDPKTDVFGLFPNFKDKRDQSIALRKELAQLVEVIHAAESNPEKKQTETLEKALREFMKGSVRFLFYKDTETVERFIEEILVTRENKDLVPLLHRFGAYLETLFGQVNLRAVLEGHPFEAK